MAYTPTNWVDNVTPVNAANLNNLEAGVGQGGIPADVVVAAATNLIRNRLLAGDANPAFMINGLGAISWGAGGASAPDLSFNRRSAGLLRVAGSFEATGSVAAAVAANKILLGSDGIIYLGSASDASLYREDVGILHAGDHLVANKTLEAWRGTGASTFLTSSSGDASGNSQIGFGGGDTSLTRISTGVLKASGVLIQVGVYGTSLPAGPVDGQEFVLVDSLTAPTFAWAFRYNAGSTSPYKWEFVGGSPKSVAVETSEACSLTTAGDLATVGPSFVLPRAGDYDFAITVGVNVNTLTSWTLCQAILNVNGATTTPTISTFTPLMPAQLASGQGQAFGRLTAQTSGWTAKLIYFLAYTGSGSGACQFFRRRLSVVPVRVS